MMGTVSEEFLELPPAFAWDLHKTRLMNRSACRHGGVHRCSSECYGTFQESLRTLVHAVELTCEGNYASVSLLVSVLPDSVHHLAPEERHYGLIERIRINF